MKREALRVTGASFYTNVSHGQNGLSWAWHFLFFLVCAVAVASHLPSLLEHPPFYAEDGSVWYLDAYSLGWWRPLLSPSGGYLNTLPRLAASLALLFPFAWAPLVMNIVGVAIQVLPASVLLLRRSEVWGSLPVRALQAAVYLLLPNVQEIHVVITNAQFHLALAAFLLVVAYPPQTKLGSVAEALLLLVSGLTGPFCFGLLLVALAIWWKRRTAWSLLVVSVELFCVLVQTCELIFGPGRPVSHLGASLNRLIRILAVQVYGGALFGRNSGAHLPLWLLAIVAVSCTALMLICMRKGSWELRMFSGFATILFGAALWKPLSTSPGLSGWVGLANGSWSRYWFFPMLAFVWCLVWAATQDEAPALRWIGRIALALMLRGVTRDWRYGELPQRNFPESARQLDLAHEGDLLTFNLIPDGWSMQINKKGSMCKNPPIASVQEPTLIANSSGTLDLSGWVVATEQMKEISIEADTHLLQVTPVDVVRPDLDALYPLAANRIKGWSAHVPLSSLPPGARRIVTLRAHEEHGCHAVIGTLSVSQLNHRALLIMGLPQKISLAHRPNT